MNRRPTFEELDALADGAEHGEFWIGGTSHGRGRFDRDMVMPFLSELVALARLGLAREREAAE